MQFDNPMIIIDPESDPDQVQSVDLDLVVTTEMSVFKSNFALKLKAV